jgi:hypothetical protein
MIVQEPWNSRFEDYYVLVTEVPDISTQNSAGYIVVPVDGYVVKAYSVIAGAITGGDAEVTLSDGTTNFTNGVITIANSGSAAGDVDSCTPTANNEVSAGDIIKAISDGGSTNAVLARITLVVKKQRP